MAEPQALWEAPLPTLSAFQEYRIDPSDDDYNYYGSENETQCEYVDWTPTHIVIPTIYFLVFVLGMSGNGLVLWTIYRNQEKRRSADTFIASLALADLTFVFTLPLWAVYAALGYHWPFSSLVCKFSSYLVSLNMYASVFCLTCLSFDRYLAIVHSLTNGKIRSKLSGLVATALLWVLAAILALPAIVFRGTGRGEGEKTACLMDFSGVATNSTEVYWTAGLGISSTLLGFVVPFAVMLTCYLFIGRTIASHFQRQQHEGVRKRRLLSIITTLVACFALCWLPFHLVKTIYLLMNLEVLPMSCGFHAFLSNIHPYTTCLAYVNSCLNPFLYAFFDSRFREQCLAVLSCGKLRPLRMGRPGSRLDDKSGSMSSGSHQGKQSAETKVIPGTPTEEILVPCKA